MKINTNDEPIILQYFEANSKSQIDELKELKRKKFHIDKELEYKTELLLKLHENSNSLQLTNKSLRKKLKETENKNFNLEFSKYNTENNNNNCDNTAIISDIPYVNTKIEKLKEELNELIFADKTKEKYLKEIKIRNKIECEKIEKIVNETNELDNYKQILDRELKNIENNYNEKELKIQQENEIKNNSNKKNSTINKELLGNLLKSIEKALSERETLESCLNQIKSEISDTNKKIEHIKCEFTNITVEIEKNQDVYVTLSRDKYEMNKMIKFYESYLVKYEGFVKTVENDLLVLKNKFRNNKSLFEKIEENLTYTLYFIRFSNSLVRSFFNIINTRRLQIEMIKNLHPEEKQAYDFMFKKLDELQSKLEKEYKDYVLLCGHDEISDKSFLG
jgi:chromosome segregation protein